MHRGTTTIQKCCAASGELHKQPHRGDPAEIASRTNSTLRACNAKVAEAFLTTYQCMLQISAPPEHCDKSHPILLPSEPDASLLEYPRNIFPTDWRSFTSLRVPGWHEAAGTL
jgi:hypothetical protein